MTMTPIPETKDTQPTVREQLAEALDDQRLAVEIFIVEMDKAMVGPSTYERGQKLAGLLGDLQHSLGDSKLALDRHRAEPEQTECESAGYLLPYDTSCRCYQEGANEGHSAGCNDDSCACWAAGHTAGLEAQRERVGGGTA